MIHFLFNYTSIKCFIAFSRGYLQHQSPNWHFRASDAQTFKWQNTKYYIIKISFYCYIFQFDFHLFFRCKSFLAYTLSSNTGTNFHFENRHQPSSYNLSKKRITSPVPYGIQRMSDFKHEFLPATKFSIILIKLFNYFYPVNILKFPFPSYQLAAVQPTI